MISRHDWQPFGAGDERALSEGRSRLVMFVLWSLILAVPVSFMYFLTRKEKR